VKVSTQRGLSGAALAVVYVCVCTAAVAVALLLGLLTLSLARALTRTTGLAATAMLLAQFVTSGRFEAVSARIGLDRTMGFHRLAAIGLLAMLALHILSLLLRGPSDLTTALGRLLQYAAAPSMRSGGIATLLLLVLTLWARFGRSRFTRYELWRGIHGLGAMLAAALALHHAWSVGYAVHAPALKLWLGLLLAVAAAAILIVYVLRPLRAYRTGATVAFVHRASHDIIELGIKLPDATPFSFSAGQFAWLAFGGRHTVTDNPFSFASAPRELPLLRFLVREVGDRTQTFAALEPGTSVAIDGPHGSLVLRGHDGPVLLIAGGIGIAPILSLWRDLLAGAPRHPVRLLAAARDPAGLVARAEIAAAQGDVRAIFLAEQGDAPGTERGTLAASHLARLLDRLDPAAVRVFLCGPAAMMDAAVDLLLAAGIAPANIVVERFDYDAAKDRLCRAERRRQAAAIAAVFAVTVAAAALAAL
jgi:predicted ferric reductase